MAGGGVPTVERPPKGLDAYWTGAFRAALKSLKLQGSWAPEQKPLLDEYVYALREAEQCRSALPLLINELRAWLDENASPDTPAVAWSTVAQLASGLPVQWDRHVKRAQALADQLLLSERGRKAGGLGASEEVAASPFAGLDAEDEVGRRRESRAR